MSEREEKARKIVIEHLEALKNRNIDGVVKDYAEDVVVIFSVMDEPLVGRAALRAASEGFINNVLIPEVASLLKIEKIETLADGEIAFVLYSCGPALPLASDTYIIKDGKIVYETAVVQFGQAN